MSEEMETIKKTILSWASQNIEPALLIDLWIELFVFNPRILVRNVLCSIADFFSSFRVVGRMRSLRHACHLVQPPRHVHNWFRTSPTFDNPINTVNRSVSFPSPPRPRRSIWISCRVIVQSCTERVRIVKPRRPRALAVGESYFRCLGYIQRVQNYIIPNKAVRAQHTDGEIVKTTIYVSITVVVINSRPIGTGRVVWNVYLRTFTPRP